MWIAIYEAVLRCAVSSLLLSADVGTCASAARATNWCDDWKPTWRGSSRRDGCDPHCSGPVGFTSLSMTSGSVSGTSTL